MTKSGACKSIGVPITSSVLCSGFMWSKSTIKQIKLQGYVMERILSNYNLYMDVLLLGVCIYD